MTNITLLLPHFTIGRTQTSLEDLLDKEQQKMRSFSEKIRRFLNQEGIPHVICGDECYCFAPGGAISSVVTEEDVKKAKAFWDPILSGKRSLASLKTKNKNNKR